MTTQQRISDRLAIVVLNFRQWTGETVLNKEDFQLGQGGKLPPEQVAHLGSKRICNPEDLRIFASIKQRAVRLLESYGVPYLGGWAIPLEKSQEVLLTLDKYVKEYEVAKASFLQHYDQAVNDWIAQNPEFGSEILRSIKTKSHVESRIRSGYSVFKVQALNGKSSTFDAAEAGLGETLLAEVAKTARELYKRSFAGKDQVTARAVDPIRRIRARLAGLAFVDGGILPVINTIDSTLQSISKSGPYKGSDFYQLNSIVLVLCNEDRMRDLSQAVSVQATQQVDEFSLVSEDSSLVSYNEEQVKAPSNQQEVSSIQEQPRICTQHCSKELVESEDLSLNLDDELDAFLNAKQTEFAEKTETKMIVSDITSNTVSKTEETKIEEIEEQIEASREREEMTQVIPSISQSNDNASMFW